jgi:hypothetical protein
MSTNCPANDERRLLLLVGEGSGGELLPEIIVGMYIKGATKV